MTLIATALLVATTSFAGTSAVDTDASDNIAVALDAADPAGGWELLPVVPDTSTAARAKADILVDLHSGIVVAQIIDTAVLKQRPYQVLSSTGQALVGVEPDEIDFSSAVASMSDEELARGLSDLGDTAMTGIDPDEIDVASMLKTGMDWLVVNKDGSVAGLVIALGE